MSHTKHPRDPQRPVPRSSLSQSITSASQSQGCYEHKILQTRGVVTLKTFTATGVGNLRMHCFRDSNNWLAYLVLVPLPIIRRGVLSRDQTEHCTRCFEPCRKKTSLIGKSTCLTLCKLTTALLTKLRDTPHFPFHMDEPHACQSTYYLTLNPNKRHQTEKCLHKNGQVGCGRPTKIPP